MSVQQLSSDSVPSQDQSLRFTSVILRVLAGGIAAAVILKLFGLTLSSGKTSPAQTWQGIVVAVISGILYVAVMAPLALRLPYRGHIRFIALFVPLYVTGALADLLEAYFFTTTLTPFTLIIALIFEAISFAAISLILVWLFPASASEKPAPGLGQRSWGSWLGRILLAGILYVPIYYLFSTLVTPIEAPFYSDPSFVAQLHTRVQPGSVIVVLEAVRGVLFALALLPALIAMRGPRWSMILYLTLIGAVVEAWVPLLGLTAWPLVMRGGNLLELTGDAFGRGIVIAFLLALPQAARMTRRIDQQGAD